MYIPTRTSNIHFVIQCVYVYVPCLSSPAHPEHEVRVAINAQLLHILPWPVVGNGGCCYPMQADSIIANRQHVLATVDLERAVASTQEYGKVVLFCREERGREKPLAT